MNNNPDPDFQENSSYIKVVEDILQLIREGNFLPGDQLPDIAELQTKCHASKGTVLKSLKELSEHGTIYTVQRQGIYLRSAETSATRSVEKVEYANYPFTRFRSQNKVFSWTPTLGAIRLDGEAAFIRAKLNHALIREYQLLWEAGIPANSQVAINELTDNLLTDFALHYGIQTDKSQVCFMRGKHEGLKNVLDLIRNCGHGYIVVRSTCSRRLSNLLFNCGFELYRIEAEDWDAFAKELALLCSVHPIKAVYIESRSDYVYGDALPEETGRELLELAAQYHFPFIEADYHREVCFERFLPLIAQDQRSVIYTGCLSHTLPALSEIEFVIASADVITSLKNRSERMNMATILHMQATSTLYKSGKVVNEAMQNRSMQKKTRKLLNSELSKRIKAPFWFSSAGTALLISVPTGIRATTVRQMLERHNIFAEDILTARRNGELVRVIRLNYGSIEPRQATPVAQKLGMAINSIIAVLYAK